MATALGIGSVRQGWEPFFGRGSEVILNSWVSRLLPISDAALGAIGYALDVVTGVIGGRQRWKLQQGGGWAALKGEPR